jgi:hypothetical protein
MNDEDKKEVNESNDSSIYYILGGVVLVAAVAGFFLLKPKEKNIEPSPSPVVQGPVVSPTPAPITKLACEKQYYNPMTGLGKYYVSMEGVDTLTSGDVTCEFTFTVKDKVVATSTAVGKLEENSTRGGAVFRCQTVPAVELARGIPTKVTVKVENPKKEKAECSQNFIFP